MGKEKPERWANSPSDVVSRIFERKSLYSAGVI